MRKMFKKVFGTILAVTLLLGSLSGAVLAEKTYPDAEKWGFEEDWSMFSDTTCILGTNIFYDTDGENRSLRIVGAEGATNIGVSASYKSLEENSGKTLYVTGKIKAEGLSTDSSVLVALLDGAKTTNALSNRVISSRKYTADCDWTDIYLDQTVKYKFDDSKDMYVVILLTGAGTVYADDFALVHDDNMTKNPNFVKTATANVSGSAPWIRVSNDRGAWGTSWSYEEGALKNVRTKDTEWLYMLAPYSNKMQSGEIYKVSIDFKSGLDSTKAPTIYVLNSAIDSKKYTLAHCGSAVTLSPVGDVVANEFTTYVGYFTMPEEKTHYGYAIQGTNSANASVTEARRTNYYDNFYVEKDETSAPYVEDASDNGTIEAGETVTAKMHLAETAETNVELIIAVYSKVGNTKRLEAVNIGNFTVGTGIENDYSKNGIGDIAVSVSAPSDAGKEYIAKAFCWDADNMLTPLP